MRDRVIEWAAIVLSDISRATERAAWWLRRQL